MRRALMSVVSLTRPNVYWGGEDVSVQAAVEANDNVADGKVAYPGPVALVCPAALGVPAARRGGTGARLRQRCRRRHGAGQRGRARA